MKLFFICAVPRSGSHLLMSLLNSLSYFKVSGEMFTQSSWEKYTDFPYSQVFEASDEVVSSVVDQIYKGDSNSEVFGGKVHLRHIPIVLQWLRYKQIPLTDVYWIWLQRRNKIRQSISFLKAQQTGQWNDVILPNEDSVEISRQSIETMAMDFLVKDLLWLEFFEKYELTPLELVYEYLSTDHELYVQKCLDFLGISYSLPLNASTELIRQSTALDDEFYEIFTSQWIEHKGW